jgi:acyl-ACP thioesterase
LTQTLEYRESFRIRANEANFRGQLNLPSLCNYLVETASNHACELRFGYDDLSGRYLFWVLSHLSLDILDYPRWMDTVVVKTVPTGVDRYYAMREFECSTEENGCFARAKSSWLILDSETRKPVHMPVDMQEIMNMKHIRAFTVKRQPLHTPLYSTRRHVRVLDLDLNQHVNSVQYARWVLDAFPLEFFHGHQLNHFAISYRAEAQCGQIVHSEAEAIESSQDEFNHHIKNREGKLLISACTGWKVI